MAKNVFLGANNTPHLTTKMGVHFLFQKATDLQSMSN